MIRTLRLTLLASSIALLALAGSGCGGTKNVGNRGNFVMSFSGFGAHIGQNFFLKVVDVAAGSTVGIATPTAIAASGISITLPGIIDSGREYRVDFWVDMNGDGILDRSPNGNPPGVDASWRETGTATSSGLALTFAHNTNFVDITPF